MKIGNETELIDYIKSSREKGYSDRVLREHLIKRGFGSKDIDGLFETVGYSKTDVIEVSSKKLYLFIGIFSMLCVVCFSLLPLIFDTSKPIPLIMVSLLVLVLGYVCAIKLRELAANSSQFERSIIMIGAVSSIVTSVLFLYLNKVIILFKHSSQINLTFNYFIYPVLNPFVFGIIFMMLFSLPSIMYYFKYENRNHKILFLYLGWLVVYFVVHRFIMLIIL